MIYFLIYSSKAVNSFDQKDLDNIARTSKTKNQLLNITGMLLGMEGHFMQYLEGPEENVKKVFEKIKEDERHNQLELRAEGKIARRIFREWSLGTWLMPKRKFIELSGLYDIKRFLSSKGSKPPEAFVYIDLFNDILRSWIDEEKELSETLKEAR